jgi:hypothetical protein
MKRHLAYQFGSIIAMLAMTAGAQAAGIATVTDVVNEGYRTPPGSEEMAARRADELIQNEALRTDDDSSMRVKFIDGSELGVESASEVVLSNYVFDGAAAEGLINLNNGLFHFTSNGKDDQRVQLRTPVATIGIRGTEFMVHVDRDNATVIDILSGAVEAKPTGKGKPVICFGGQSILIPSAEEDARCGDLGSFSTAAGPAVGKDRPQPGHGGQNDKSQRPERPDRDPPSDGGEGGEGEGGEGGGGEGGPVD